MGTPKKPQDHKPKTEKPVIEPFEGGRKVTHMGVTVTVLNEAFDDFEFLRNLRRQNDETLDEGSRMFAMIDSFDRLFGADSDKVLAALRVDGRVPLTTAATFVRDVIGAINPNS